MDAYRPCLFQEGHERSRPLHGFNRSLSLIQTEQETLLKGKNRVDSRIPHCGCDEVYFLVCYITK